MNAGVAAVIGGDRDDRVKERGGMPRRAVLAGLGAVMFAGPSAASASTTAPKRLVVLDWGLAETLIALRCPLAGVAEIPNYDHTVVAPSVPAGAVDVGLRLAPNLELLHRLAPDLILINSSQGYMKPALDRFGPVLMLEIFSPDGMPYRRSREAAMQLGRRLGLEPAATELIEHADAVMQSTRRRLGRYDGQPVCIFNFLDGQHVNVFGRTSLFQGVLDEIGVSNAWQGPSGFWGNAIIGIEQLARVPEARLVLFGKVPPAAMRTMSEGVLWHHLPAIRAGRVTVLPPIWAFGAVPSAMRIAELLGAGLAPEAA